MAQKSHYDNSEVEDFHRINHLYIIEGKLKNISRIRVGVGRGGEQLFSPSDSPITRLNGQPYIPGSSLKGIFRSHVERLAATILKQDLHSPFDDIQEIEKDKKCVICAIFGNTLIASHVRIFDAFPEKEPTTTIKPGIGINRVFGGVQPGIGPFHDEYVNPGTRWTFRMDVYNIDLLSTTDFRAILIQQLIKDLQNGLLQVGGKTSTGAGLIALEETTITKIEYIDGKPVSTSVKLP
ncbi:MAG: RAMP superfamily CRISPR-associated protein [Candidatus Caldarchaeum sp.]|nr:RAMP superfamily CRISPR-associated protein [Candidatus Caldarchaeum sp.]